MDGQAVRNEIEYLTKRNLLMAEELKEYESGQRTDVTGMVIETLREEILKNGKLIADLKRP